MALGRLFRTMVRSRELERAVADLWHRGAITGEMHVATGEEAVAAGVVDHLGPGDALALTHRCTPFIVARGVPLRPLLAEMLGREDGLCGGCAGHMHLMSRDHRFAASGIVGASLPAGAGFALSARRRGAIAIAQTGDGALNQGMALETLNLAVAWKLPLLVVCIDNGWAITTPAGSLTGGSLTDRASAFGWTVGEVDGTDVEAVHAKAGELISGVRGGYGPAFLYAKAPRMDGHYLGDPLGRVAHDPLGDGRHTLEQVMEGVVSRGGGLMARAAGLTRMVGTLGRAATTPKPGGRQDAITIAARRLGAAVASEVETQERAAVAQVVEEVFGA